VTQISHEEYMRNYEARRQGEILRNAANEKRSQEEMRKLKRSLAEKYGNGQTTIHRGADAIMGYANLGDTFDKDLALKMLATHDSARAAQKRQAINNMSKGKKTPEAAKKAVESKLGRSVSIKINFGTKGLDL